MASGTAPINSSRGAADTTAGRIYFSTPSAQVRIPLTGPLLPPPTSAHTILLGGKIYDGGKIFPRRRKNYKGASADGRWPNIYPGRAQVPKNSKKNPKTVAQCRKYPIPNLYTLNRTIPYLYTLRLIPLIHWIDLYPILIHWADLYPILIHWAELYPMLIHWAELYPILIH